VKADSQRVVITGIGCVTPLGLDAASTWDAAIAGQGGVAPITRFDASELPVRFAAEVKGEPDPGDLEPKELRRFDRVVRYALAAARESLLDAKLEVTDANRDRIGVAVGSGTSVGVAVGGTSVAVGSGVSVGGTSVAVGSGVIVGGISVAVGSGVAVGGTGVAVGGAGVAVGGRGSQSRAQPLLMASAMSLANSRSSFAKIKVSISATASPTLAAAVNCG